MQILKIQSHLSQNQEQSAQQKINLKFKQKINQQSKFMVFDNSNEKLRNQSKDKRSNKQYKKQLKKQPLNHHEDNYNNIKNNNKIKKKSAPPQNHHLFEQQDYNPDQKTKKTFPYTITKQTKQKTNRNIIPNQVNQIFSYIQKPSKSTLILQRLFAKYPPENQSFSIKRFYLYQSLLKEKISNYINEYTLPLVTQLYEPRCQVYPEQQQRYYNKICRVLIHHFLQEDSIFNILTSRRMQRNKKKKHLQMRRVLKQKVIQILRK